MLKLPKFYKTSTKIYLSYYMGYKADSTVYWFVKKPRHIFNISISPSVITKSDAVKAPRRQGGCSVPIQFILISGQHYVNIFPVYFSPPAEKFVGRIVA